MLGRTVGRAWVPAVSRGHPVQRADPATVWMALGGPVSTLSSWARWIHHRPFALTTPRVSLSAAIIAPARDVRLARRSHGPARWAIIASVGPAQGLFRFHTCAGGRGRRRRARPRQLPRPRPHRATVPRAARISAIRFGSRRRAAPAGTPPTRPSTRQPRDFRNRHQRCRLGGPFWPHGSIRAWNADVRAVRRGLEATSPKRPASRPPELKRNTRRFTLEMACSRPSRSRLRRSPRPSVRRRSRGSAGDQACGASRSRRPSPDDLARGALGEHQHRRAPRPSPSQTARPTGPASEARRDGCGECRERERPPSDGISRALPFFRSSAGILSARSFAAR